MDPIIHRTAVIDGTKARVRLEKDVTIGPFCVLISKSEITIGENTRVGPHVTMVDVDHDMKLPIKNVAAIDKKEPIHIGKHCWIGANAVILKGVTLGDGCIVGAGAIVTKSFPEMSVIVGNPARLLRKRNAQ